MGTIVQEYGPIYGEVVNGTVQGRPNGSVYVPLSNTIELSISGEEFYVQNSTNPTYYVFVTVGYFQVSAESQDMANYLQTQVFVDAECTTELGTRSYNAGIFNLSNYQHIVYVDKTDPNIPDVGDTVYFRAQLMSMNGTPVATSDVTSLERRS